MNPQNPKSEEKCPVCKGRKYVPNTDSSAAFGFVLCPDCLGTGKKEGDVVEENAKRCLVDVYDEGVAKWFGDSIRANSFDPDKKFHSLDHALRCAGLEAVAAHVRAEERAKHAEEVKVLREALEPLVRQCELSIQVNDHVRSGTVGEGVLQRAKEALARAEKGEGE